MTPTIIYQYAQCPDGPIHFAEAGSGETLLLLHATPRSHRSFRNMLPLLAPHCRALAIDTPGFGNSAPLPSKITVEALASMLIDFMDQQNIAQAHVFGLHSGNKIGAALAAGWTKRIKSLIVAGHTHSLIANSQSRDAAIHALSDHYPPHYAEAPDGAQHIRAWVAAHAEAQQLWWQQNLISSSNIESKDIEYAEARVIDYLLGRHSIPAMYEAIFAFNFNAALAQVEAPTLILELLTPDEAHHGEQAAKLCSLMKRARPARVKPGDRSSLEKNPLAIVTPILDFLALLATAARSG